MSIPEDKIAKLRSFGYTEVEGRFLYLVATHSGYFTLGQFLDFAHAKSGKRNARLVEKMFTPPAQERVYLLRFAGSTSISSTT